MQKKPKYLITGFLIGASVLSFFSIFQKYLLGADPFALIGFIVPIMFGGTAGATIAGFLYKQREMNRGLQQKVDSKTQNIQQLLDEKEMLLKEVHHRIKNNMTVIRSLLYLHTGTAENDRSNTVIKEAIAKIDSMSVLYEQLFLSENYEVSSMKDYVGNLMDKFSTIFPNKAHIRIHQDIQNLQLKAAVVFPLGLLLNELFTNSMKYAFEGKKEGTISVRLCKEQQRAVLFYQDDGVGIPAAILEHKKKGYGFKLIDLLCQQIGAAYSIKSTAGTEIKISFDLL